MIIGGVVARVHGGGDDVGIANKMAMLACVGDDDVVAIQSTAFVLQYYLLLRENVPLFQ